MALEVIYARTVAAFQDRVEKIGTHQWSNPTPCAEWDVRTLVNHVVYEQLWSVPLLDGATIAEVGDQFEGDVLGDDPIGSAGAAARGAQDAVSSPDVLGRTVHLSFGDTPGEEYVYQLLADHLVHGWDLAVGSNGDRTLDAEAVQVCLDWFADREDIYRGSGAIGPRIEVSESASPQDRLIAAFGRDPHA